MASGVQALANEGLHHEPYYVEFIDGPDGERIYTHLDPGSQVLDRDAALQTVEIMKGPIYGGGTGRRAAFDDRRPAFGKTGTQQDNTNAWFVGGTKQLSTAVWVGDPNAYTPMQWRPGVRRCGLRPQRAGRALPGGDLEHVHGAGARVLPAARLGASGAASRPNARLFLPGNECESAWSARSRSPASRGRSECAHHHAAAAERGRHRRSRRFRRRRSRSSSRCRSAPRSRRTTSIRSRRCRRCLRAPCSDPAEPAAAGTLVGNDRHRRISVQRTEHDRRAALGAPGGRHPGRPTRPSPGELAVA